MALYRKQIDKQGAFFLTEDKEKDWRIADVRLIDIPPSMFTSLLPDLKNQQSSSVTSLVLLRSDNRENRIS